MESNQKLLSELFNDYIDEEMESYSAQRAALCSNGLDLVFQDLEIDDNDDSYWCQRFLIRRPHFGKFLEVSALIIEKGWSSNNIRESSYKLVLFSDEEVQLSFRTPHLTSNKVITSTVSQLQERHNKESSRFIEENLLKSLGPDFIKSINESGELTITIKVVKPSALRLSKEEEHGLENTRTFLRKILSKSEFVRIFSNMPLEMRVHRLKLWGFQVGESSSAIDSALNTLPFDDFNIKNVLHLKYIKKHFHSKSSNLELLHCPEEVLNLSLKHQIFQKKLSAGSLNILPK